MYVTKNMQNNIYKEYADIKFQTKALELREAELKKAILNDLKSQKLNKVESEFGNFTVASKNKYTYSKKIQKLEEDLKIKKNEEVEKGNAKVEVTEYIMYKPLEA